MAEFPKQILHQADVEEVIAAKVLALQPPGTSTTTLLADIDDVVNTTGKVVGKQVFNTTTGAPVFATGVDPEDVWNDAVGTLAHTPV